MNKKTTLFVLGAEDPEMRLIESVLSDHNYYFGYALINDNIRCNAGNAYQTTTTSVNTCDFDFIIFVECEVKDIMPYLIIDHHRKGDPGYDKTPQQFLSGSSIGQLCKLLGIEPDSKIKHIAALDHCFPKALKGECPNIDPDYIKSLKYNEIATNKNISTQTVYSIINAFFEKMDKTPTVNMNNQSILDLRHIPFSELYSVGYLIVQCALVENNQAAIISFPEDGVEKVIFTGCIEPDTVDYFMNIWAPENNLSFIYGVPERGYAGGYLI